MYAGYFPLSSQRSCEENETLLLGNSVFNSERQQFCKDKQLACAESQKATEVKAILLPLYNTGRVLYAVTSQCLLQNKEVTYPPMSETSLRESDYA